MSGFSFKDGWHPKGKDGQKESWRGDFKGINQVVGASVWRLQGSAANPVRRDGWGRARKTRAHRAPSITHTHSHLSKREFWGRARMTRAHRARSMSHNHCHLSETQPLLHHRRNDMVLLQCRAKVLTNATSAMPRATLRMSISSRQLRLRKQPRSLRHPQFLTV